MRLILAFIWKYSFFFLFLVLEAASLYILANQSYFQRAKITAVSNRVVGTVYGAWTGVTHYFSLSRENELLTLENARLREALKYSQLTADTSAGYLIDTLYRQQYRYTPAKVINNTTAQPNNYLMLNKGSRHGITPDMAVVSGGNVIGTTISVTENFSWVMSVLNTHSKISARINRVDQIGTAIWEGKTPTYGTLVDVPTHVKITKGDTIVTSGFSSIFPEGLMMGTVESAELDKSAHFFTVKFRYSADLNSVRNVIIIKNLFREEQTELEETKIED